MFICMYFVTYIFLRCIRTFLEAVGRVSQEGEDGALLSLGPGDEMFYTFFVPTDGAFRTVNQVRRNITKDDEGMQTTIDHDY